MIHLLKGNHLILYIVAASFIIKSITLFMFPLFDFPDGRSYLGTAEVIMDNGYLWPAEINHEAPLGFYYYSLLYPFYDWFGGKWYLVGNIIVASLTIFYMYKIALEIYGQEAANLSALIALLYPYFTFYAIHPLLETPFNLVLYISFYYAVLFMKFYEPKYLYLFSAFFALTVLMKFSGLPIYPLVLLLMIYFFFKRFGFKRAAGVCLGALVVFAFVMSPWWVRNYYIHDTFVATSVGESGKVLYTGNNPMNKSGGGITGIDVDFSAFDHIESLAEKDQAMREAAINWIIDNPSDWLILTVRKLIRFYSPVIFTDYFDKWYYQILSVLTYGTILILFLTGLYNQRNKMRLISPILFYAILLTGIHLIFIASLRYRLPLEPFMIIVASGMIIRSLLPRLKFIR